MQKIKAILVGQPNVGKSELINSITGANLKVGNFSGVTIEKKSTKLIRKDSEITLIDLPGIYNLNVYSPEEQVTKDYLLKRNYDVIINVVDANALKRNLILTLQLLDLNKNTILAINMIDEAEAIGTIIDVDIIKAILGIPVILISAKKLIGLNTLVDEMSNCSIKKNNQIVNYNLNIEKSITILSKILKTAGFDENTSRFYSIRLLENDKDIYKLIHAQPVFFDIYEKIKEEKENISRLESQIDSTSTMSSVRMSISKFIYKRSVKNKKYNSKTEKIDNILIHKYLGLPIFFFFMWLLFQATFTLGQYPMNLIENITSYLSIKSNVFLPQGIIGESISQGLIPGIGTVVGFLPNILILFMGISILEQSGYIARVSYLLDGILKRFGLPGKAFIPMITGFGCSIPAYLAARTLKNPKDKLITMLIISFFSCPARLPVYILFISAFFPNKYAGNILFMIYLTGIIMALVVSKIFRITLFNGEMEPFVMEMPKYRLPSLKRLALEFRLKLTIFLKRAGLFIGVSSIFIWFLSSFPKNLELESLYKNKIAVATTQELKTNLLNQYNSLTMENSYLGIIGKTIEPIFSPLGFDWKMSIAIISALAAKEVAISTLATLNYSSNNEVLIETIRNNIDFKSGIAFIIIIMVYSPCLAAISTFLSEIKDRKWRVFYIVYPNILAWILAYVVYNILSILK